MKKVLFACVVLALTAFTNHNQHAGGYHVGDVATDFSLKGTDGNMHSLSGIENANGYVVIFTCNHCPYAKAYEDRIIQLQAEFGPKGYPIVAINPNDPSVVEEDSYDNMKKRYSEKGFNFLYLIDEGQTIYPQYGATRTPHVFLLDKNRVVKYIGAIDDNASNADKVKERYLANAINALIAGETPSPASTKAIGCSIKKKK
ncbi:MAG: thioredoxin family protein [Bacteroidia bacterium]|nr:thioredoxin family protein [Bacteroidia bacterium]